MTLFSHTATDALSSFSTAVAYLHTTSSSKLYKKLKDISYKCTTAWNEVIINKYRAKDDPYYSSSSTLSSIGKHTDRLETHKFLYELEELSENPVVQKILLKGLAQCWMYESRAVTRPNPFFIFFQTHQRAKIKYSSADHLLIVEATE